jgi:long-chain fatty acid transport protein
MDSPEKYYLLGIAIAALIGVPGVSEATNGYFAHGTGTRGKALAGAITALPQNAISAAVNPAWPRGADQIFAFIT